VPSVHIGYQTKMSSLAHLVWPTALLPAWGWLIAVLAPAVGLFLLRSLPQRPLRWAGGQSHSLKPKPSLAHLVWPIALLPLSGWLTYFVTSCPGNPGLTYPMVKAVATYFGPPLLLAALVVTLRFRSGHPVLSTGGAIALALGFLAACAWAWWLFILAVMAECGA
jgi:hypothetical protein